MNELGERYLSIIKSELNFIKKSSKLSHSIKWKNNFFSFLGNLFFFELLLLLKKGCDVTLSEILKIMLKINESWLAIKSFLEDRF